MLLLLTLTSPLTFNVLAISVASDFTAIIHTIDQNLSNFRAMK